jgi:hypothetical protein
VYAHTDKTHQFPFWILTIWRAIPELHDAQRGWRAMLSFLSSLDKVEAMMFRANMDTLTWSQSVAVDRLRNWTPVHSLSQFASRDWLNDSNLNVMLDVMYEQIRVTDVTVEAKYEVQNSFFCVILAGPC